MGFLHVDSVEFASSRAKAAGAPPSTAAALAIPPPVLSSPRRLVRDHPSVGRSSCTLIAASVSRLPSARRAPVPSIALTSSSGFVGLKWSMRSSGRFPSRRAHRYPRGNERTPPPVVPHRENARVCGRRFPSLGRGNPKPGRGAHGVWRGHALADKPPASGSRRLVRDLHPHGRSPCSASIASLTRCLRSGPSRPGVLLVTIGRGRPHHMGRTAHSGCVFLACVCRRARGGQECGRASWVEAHVAPSAGGQISSSCTARTAASPREPTPSLARMLPTCFEAVRELMKSRSAIYRSDRPATSSRNTSRSRGLSTEAGRGTPASSSLTWVRVANRGGDAALASRKSRHSPGNPGKTRSPSGWKSSSDPTTRSLRCSRLRPRRPPPGPRPAPPSGEPRR